MGLFVNRDRGVCRNRIPGDATKAEAFEGLILFIILWVVVLLARYG